jgi:hypothetical protein
MKDLTLNDNRKCKVVAFGYILAFIWRPTRGRLLNMMKVTQNFYFIRKVFQIFKEYAIKCSLKIFFSAFW